MKILQQFIKGKHPDPSLCEDMLFISADFIAVIDGATSKHPRLFNGKSGGRAAAEAVYNALNELSHDASACDAVKHITEKVASLYEPTEEKCTAVASAIIYSNYRKEIWSVGDCQCIINKAKYLHEKEIDLILAKQRAQIIKTAIENGASFEELMANDIGRDAILPQIKEQHKYVNQPCVLGYGVFNGSAVPDTHIKIYTLQENDTVILSSDGYPVLCDTLEESETLLEKEIAENPLCYLDYKSTKGLSKGNLSFDDRAYIKFIV